MDELDVTIEVYTGRITDVELKILTFSDHGRYPSHDEFYTMATALGDLKILNAQVDILLEVKRAIESNAK